MNDASRELQVVSLQSGGCHLLLPTAAVVELVRSPVTLEEGAGARLGWLYWRRGRLPVLRAGGEGAGDLRSARAGRPQLLAICRSLAEPPEPELVAILLDRPPLHRPLQPEQLEDAAPPSGTGLPPALQWAHLAGHADPLSIPDTAAWLAQAADEAASQSPVPDDKSID